MNYKLKCESCGKNVKVNSHGAVKFYDVATKVEELSIDCPECDEEIVLTKLYTSRRR